MLTVIVTAALRFSGDDETQQSPIPNLGQPPRASQAASTQRKRPSRRPRSQPARRATLLIRAVRGDCWLDVRAGSAAGEQLFRGTLETGDAMRFSKRRLWISFGAPSNVDLRLNGRRTTLDAGPRPVVLVTPKGIEPQAA